MLATSLTRRSAWLPSLGLSLVLLTGCDEDVVEPDPADSVVAMRVVIGNTTVTINEGNQVTGGPVVIPAGITNMTVSFLDESNNVVSGLDEFELRVTVTNTALVRFDRTGAFAGTLTRLGAG